MKYLILSILLLSGCANFEMPTPTLDMYAESDYVYTRIGLCWGNREISRKFQEEDFMLQRGSSHGGGSSGNGGGSISRGGCGGGSCHP